ncbi:MAG: COX15/CtaA family protein [Bacteroidota bacterium]
MKQYFIFFAKLSLILVYLVIVAGAVVRMTGSGMGCPDWPKCFGYYIPPTDAEVLQWQPNREFKSGQVIIKDEALFVAQMDFTSSASYAKENWAPYTKHDYAIFNVWHTWIEYINRLVGALAGLATLFMALFSFSLWGTRPRLVLFSWIVVFAMGFQAWLGATVVYSVLEPLKITLHMLMALAIVGLLLVILRNNWNVNFPEVSRWTKVFILFGMTLTLAQIVMGTQVRQFVDHQIDLVGENAKNLWLQRPAINFYVHRSFSILVLLINGWIWWTFRKKGYPMKLANGVMACIALEILSGIAMYYVDFPFGSQPAHLVLASLLFGFQFALLLTVFQQRKALKTS